MLDIERSLARPRRDGDMDHRPPGVRFPRLLFPSECTCYSDHFLRVDVGHRGHQGQIHDRCLRESHYRS